MPLLQSLAASANEIKKNQNAYDGRVRINFYAMKFENSIVLLRKKKYIYATPFAGSPSDECRAIALAKLINVVSMQILFCAKDSC